MAFSGNQERGIHAHCTEVPANTIISGLLAGNTHDVWAKGRVEQGWTYGKERNDTLKQTPCLVPYEELPDSEKAYDRNTAIETLKLIVKLGYRISKGE